MGTGEGGVPFLNMFSTEGCCSSFSLEPKIPRWFNWTSNTCRANTLCDKINILKTKQNKTKQNKSKQAKK